MHIPVQGRTQRGEGAGGGGASAPPQKFSKQKKKKKNSDFIFSNSFISLIIRKSCNF